MAVPPKKEQQRRINIRRLAGFLLLAAVLALAAYFRLRGLAHSEMGSDQSILYSIAMTWVNGGALPLAANKSSAGIMNPPLIEYLIGLPLMLRTTLLSAVGFQALMGVAAVLALYLYTASLFGRRVALLAAFLFAVNPWAVYYSRFVWNPNPIPLFSTLLLGSLLASVAGGRHPIHLALALLWLAAVTQLHLSALALIPVVGLVLLIFHKRWRAAGEQNDAWKGLWPLLLGGALFLLLYVPFIIYEAAVGFADVQAAWSALRGGQATPTGSGQAVVNAASWLLALDLGTGAGFSRGHALWREAVWPAFWLLAAARWLFIAALAYAAAAPLLWWRRSQKRLPPRLVAFVVLALWVAVPVLAYLRHTVYLQHYYFLYLLPAPYLLLALFADEAGRRLKGRPERRRLKERIRERGLRRAAGVLLAAPLLLLGVWHGHVNEVGLDLLEEGAVRPGRTVAEVQTLIDSSRHLLDEHPACDLVIVAEAGTFEMSPLGLVRDFVHPRPVRFLEAGRGYIIPDGCSLYLRAAGDPLIDEWLAGGQPLAETGEGVFYRVEGEQAVYPPPLQRWENGLSLLSAEVETVPAAGQPLTLIYQWQVTETPPAADYHFFNHVLDDDGQLVAQEDAAAIDARNWQEGDALVTRFSIPLPTEIASGHYTVRVGQYTWPDLTRIPLAGGVSKTAYQVLAFEIP